MLLSSPSFLLPAAVLLGAFDLAAAQVTSDCNPTVNTTGCPVDAAFGTNFNFLFNSTPPDDTWDATAGTVGYASDVGALFQIAAQGDSPTIRTAFYIFFGRVEIWMKAATGTGIVSSMMLLSDDLDEIDWEILGGNATHAESNYFGKGVQDYHNAIYHPVTGGTVDDYHNYTIDWTNASLQYYIDGPLVRTLLPADANDTHYYPQTPMRLSLGIWAGGDPTLPAGTREWAGGDTDFTMAPFNMYIKNTHITDYRSGTAYNYTDMTGSWESIAIVKPGTNSTAATAVTAEPDETVSQKFDGLSSTTKTAIFASSGAAAAALAVAGLAYFWRQRARGAKEAALAAERMERERVEMQGYKAAGVNPDDFSEQTPEYDSRTGMSSLNMEAPPGYTHETFGAAATGAGAAAAASRPLLRNRSDSNSSHPGSLHMQTPYSDGFSPIDNNGSAPLPYGAPVNRSFSNPSAAMRSAQGTDGYGNMDMITSTGPMPQRSFTNPHGVPHYDGGYGGHGGQ